MGLVTPLGITLIVDDLLASFPCQIERNTVRLSVELARLHVTLCFNRPSLLSRSLVGYSVLKAKTIRGNFIHNVLNAGTIISETLWIIVALHG